MLQQNMDVALKNKSTNIFSKPYQALSIGIVIIETVVAFEAMAVATIMPSVVRELGGIDYYGWAFSAFMLATLIGTVISGQYADLHGPAKPFITAGLLITIGLLMSGFAPSMAFVLIGRAFQGLGGGALLAILYIAISRGYPDNLRARLTAILASAWMIPALVGPALAGFISDTISWRFVFWGIVPLLLIAGSMMYPVLTKMQPYPDTKIDYKRIMLAARLAFGLAIVLVGLNLQSWWLTSLLTIIGGYLVVPALYRLVVSGMRKIHPILPSALIVRGLLYFAFFSSEAFLVLGLVSLRSLTTTEASISLTAGALSWITASWWQARLDTNANGIKRGSRATIGLTILTSGLILMTVTLLLPVLPVWLAVLGWGIAGFGIGFAFPSLTLILLGKTPEGKEGTVSGSIQLVETFFVAIGTGLGGAILAFGNALIWHNQLSLGLIFGLNITIGLLAVIIARRKLTSV
jgi:MFS family permease